MKILCNGEVYEPSISFAVTKPRRTTMKALGFEDEWGDLVWIPKSICRLIDMENGEYSLTVSERLYSEKYLEGLI